jgi:hypothetical protein
VDPYREAEALVMLLHPLHVGGGEDGGDAAQGGHGPERYRPGYPGRMRRLFSRLIRAALVAAFVGLVRQVLLGRTSRRSLHGSEPVIGSLDTWPEVPRRPEG